MSFLTQAGEAQIANKQGNASRMTMSHFVLANVPDLGSEPSDRVAELPSDEQIVQTLPYTKHSYVNPNQVVYSLIMDSTIGDFTFNWIGLVDEEEVLIAVAHITPIEKRKSTEGVEGNTIARNFLLKYSGIQNVTGANVPAETWQLDFSARFNGMDERERLSNLDLYGQASFLDSAYQVIKEGDQYQLQAGVGYVGGIRSKLAEQETLTVSDLPCSIWLDVSLQGDVSDKATVCQIQVQTAAMSGYVSGFVGSDYVDANGVAHYVVKLANITANGDIIDHRLSYDNVAQHEAKVNPHPQYSTLTDNQALLEQFKRIPIYPHVMTDTNRLAMSLAGSQLSIEAGQVIRLFGWLDINTSDYPERSFTLDLSKTYHLRFDLTHGFRLLNLASTEYNPEQREQHDESFDATYDDVLLAAVVNGELTSYRNLQHLPKGQLAYFETIESYPLTASQVVMSLDFSNDYSRSFDYVSSYQALLCFHQGYAYGYLIYSLNGLEIYKTRRIHVGNTPGYVYSDLANGRLAGRANRTDYKYEVMFVYEYNNISFNMTSGTSGWTTTDPSYIAVEVY
ncbi:phage tail protein [Marinomonas sp. THO17]|uniref:phage tail-collar fiber domain-containing protein n=1 Tax=Marinomonas sp. THO17 TaxID=3149048 RepID=UPI00336BFF32